MGKVLPSKYGKDYYFPYKDEKGKNRGIPIKIWVYKEYYEPGYLTDEMIEEMLAGKNIEFEFTQGGEFPSDLSEYKLIIHCGGCMINEAEMQSRIKKAKEQGVNGIPIVNYGMAIAYMNGILERALRIFKDE